MRQTWVRPARSRSRPAYLKLNYRRLSFPPVARSATDNAICEKSRFSRLGLGLRCAFAFRFAFGMAQIATPNKISKFKLTHYPWLSRIAVAIITMVMFGAAAAMFIL